MTNKDTIRLSNMTLLNLKACAKILGIKYGTARNRVSRGYPMPPHMHIGRNRYYPEHLLIEWIEAQAKLSEGYKVIEKAKKIDKLVSRFEK